MRLKIAILFAALCLAVSVRAQTVITGTFLTPSGKSPSAAGLKVLQQVAGTAVCGTLDFQPQNLSVSRPWAVVWNGNTYLPQKTRAYIRCSDGALINNAGAVGIALIPNSDAQPVGTVTFMSGGFTASADGSAPAITWSESKSVPDVSTVDWGSLPVPVISQPPFYATVIGVGSMSLSLELPDPSDSGLFQWHPKNSVYIKRVTCSVDTGSAQINFEIRTEATPNSPGQPVLAVPLTCGTTTGVSTTFANPNIPIESPVALTIASTSGSPGVVRVSAEY